MNLTEIEAYSRERHRQIEQMYGQHPYEYHLEKTVNVAKIFGHTHEDIIAACWGHDLIEDTGTTKDDLKAAGFSDKAIDTIWRVTDEPGANRKEKKARTYPKIAGNLHATTVKLCDRIANIEASLEEGNKGLLAMYHNECHGMVKALQVQSTWGSTWRMWQHLDKLLLERKL